MIQDQGNVHGHVHMGAITIQWAKKGIESQRKTIKIGQIFMFFHLKSWKSWQVISFSFI